MILIDHYYAEKDYYTSYALSLVSCSYQDPKLMLFSDDYMYEFQRWYYLAIISNVVRENFHKNMGIENALKSERGNHEEIKQLRELSSI